MNHQPLTLHNIVLDGDLDRAVSAGNHLFWNHRCKSQTPTLGARFNGLNLGPMSLAYLSFKSGISITPDRNDSDLLLQVTLQGNSYTQNGNEEVYTRENDIAMIDPSQSTQISFEPDCAHFALRLDRDILASSLEQSIRTHISEPLQFQLKPGISQLNHQACIETMRFLCRFYGKPNALFDNNELLHRSQAEVVACTLLNALPHNYSERLHDDSYTAAPRHIRQACDFIEQHIHEPIAMSALADEVGVTARTLQNGFKKHMGQTPSDFIRDRRLDRIHQALQAAEGNTNVSRVMWQFGISNPGLYAKLYRERFGSNPSDTLKAAILKN